MPRMSKKLKEEWSLSLTRVVVLNYNKLCRKCKRSCKQSYRALLIVCPNCCSKRAVTKPPDTAFWQE